MRNKKKLVQSLKALEKSVGQPGSDAAFIFSAHLSELQSDAPKGKAQHEIFTEMCRSGLNALKDHQGELASSPAAQNILEYLQTAFTTYLALMDKATDKASPTDRNGFIAKAFGLVGSGRVGFTDEEQMTICSEFSGAHHELTNSQTQNPTSCITLAARAAYKAHYKREWVKDDDASKQNMKRIRAILKMQGYVP